MFSFQKLLFFGELLKGSSKNKTFVSNYSRIVISKLNDFRSFGGMDFHWRGFLIIFGSQIRNVQMYHKEKYRGKKY